MQTILGSNGQIGQEIAKEIYRNYTKDIRLVGRKPKKIHETDELVAADLMKYEDTLKAVEGSEIVYFAVGLPANSEMWEERFPVIMKMSLKHAKKRIRNWHSLIIRICMRKTITYRLKTVHLYQKVVSHKYVLI